MRAFIVTGADGFIGSHLVERLLAAPDTEQVVATALYQPDGSIGWLAEIKNPKLKVLRGDIRDQAFLRRCVLAYPTQSPITFYNLAAWVSVPKSLEMPHAYWETNATGVLTILSTLWGAIAQFIQVSTSEVFDGEGSPYAPDSPLCPVSPYGASKAAAEMLCRAWRGTTNDAVKVLRIFNTFGPRQYPRAIIPKMLREALRLQEDPSWQPSFGDGTAVRSFIPVHMTCEALIGAAAINAGVLQYGGGMEPITIRALWTMICRLVGVEAGRAVWMHSDHLRAGFEVPHLKGITSPQLAGLDAKEPLKEFEAALLKMLEWMRAHPVYCSPTDYQ